MATWRSLAGAAMAAAILVLAAACDRRQSDWESARKADTSQAYTEFLERYPQGDFTSQARARVADLKEEADWKTALGSDTVQAYQRFIEQHPGGARADEARIRIENLNLAAAPADVPAADAGGAQTRSADPAALAAASAVHSASYRVQLGAFSSATRARSEWQQALKSHPAELAGLSYRIDTSVAGTQKLYRLQTSDVSESRARAMCAALKSTRQACVVVPTSIPN
jgi:cell division protein FtsN